MSYGQSGLGLSTSTVTVVNPQLQLVTTEVQTGATSYIIIDWHLDEHTFKLFPMKGNIEICLCKYSLKLVEKQEKLSQIIFQL